MIENLQSHTTLHNGVNMPWLGLGVYKANDGQEVETAVQAAIEIGYRSIDTASFYENEAGVGRAIKQSGIKREDLFVTTKVWNTEQGYEQTLQAFENSRKKLGLDYLDLYLVHWPVPGKFVETWRAIEKLYDEGLIRAIGVSNFLEHHLEKLFVKANVKPMVNQIEYHPRLTQKNVLSFCAEQQIQVEAWSPLMRAKLFSEPTIATLAAKYEKQPSQVILRWDLQNHVVTIPKSVRKERIAENADIFDFQLTTEEMSLIDALNQDERVGPHPDEFPYE